MLRGRDSVEIAASREAVWQALLTPTSLKDIIPGCEDVQMTGPEGYTARVRISVAGIGATYDAQLRIFDRNEPTSLRLSGKATSRLGFGEGEAFVTLGEAPGGGTMLSYVYGANIGGQLAAFGQRMLDGVVRVLLASFFDRLRSYLQGGKPSDGGAARLRGFVAMLKLLWGRR